MIITLIALTQSTSKLGLGKAGLSQKNLKLGLSRVAKGFISFQFWAAMCRKLARAEKQQSLSHVDLQFHRYTWHISDNFERFFCIHSEYLTSFECHILSCMGVSSNGGTPNLHPKCWSFLVGETSHSCWGWNPTIFRFHPRNPKWSIFFQDPERDKLPTNWCRMSSVDGRQLAATSLGCEAASLWCWGLELLPLKDKIWGCFRHITGRCCIFIY